MIENKLKILIIGSYIDQNFNKLIRTQYYINKLKSLPNFNVLFGYEIEDLNSEIFDAVFVFNKVFKTVNLKVVKGNLFAIMQEPGINKIFHPYMFKKLNQFDVVYSPINQSDNTNLSIPYLIPFIDIDYNDLKNLKLPLKNKEISCVMSSKKRFSGHKLRFNFVNEYLKQSDLPISYFGRDTNFIEKKEEALLNYKYSIAIENYNIDNYVTEKFIDCLLCYTVPFYYGCTNIKTLFPEKSFIWIDITNPKKAIDTIKNELEKNSFEERIPYIEEARELILNKYNFFNLLENNYDLIKNNKNNNQVINYKIKPVKTNFFGKFYFLYEKIFKTV